MLKKILKAYSEEVLETVVGYDAACIGIDEESMQLIYSKKKIINILKKELPGDEALEYYEYNIEGSKGFNVIFCSDDF